MLQPLEKMYFFLYFCEMLGCGVDCKGSLELLIKYMPRDMVPLKLYHSEEHIQRTSVHIVKKKQS